METNWCWIIRHFPAGGVSGIEDVLEVFLVIWRWCGMVVQVGDEWSIKELSEWLFKYFSAPYRIVILRPGKSPLSCSDVCISGDYIRISNMFIDDDGFLVITGEVI